MAIVCIEGIDATGKHTQSKRLLDWFNQRAGHHALQTFPDYSTRTGQLVLSLLKEEWWPSFETWPGVAGADYTRALLIQSLMTQNRYEQLPKLRLFAESASDHLVCDRYYASGIAYGAADGLSLEYLKDIHSALPPARLWILIDITGEESVKRRPIRRDEYEKRAGFMDAVRERYLELFRDPGLPGVWKIVDGMQSRDDVHAQIIDLVNNYIGIADDSR
jgi:dTMP kinase